MCSSSFTIVLEHSKYNFCRDLALAVFNLKLLLFAFQRYHTYTQLLLREYLVYVPLLYNLENESHLTCEAVLIFPGFIMRVLVRSFNFFNSPDEEKCSDFYNIVLFFVKFLFNHQGVFGFC
jgi:hypothetical protein